MTVAKGRHTGFNPTGRREISQDICGLRWGQGGHSYSFLQQTFITHLGHARLAF